MMGVLLESRAAKQRRRGGAALSVAAHVAIISAVVVGTARGTAAPKPNHDPIVHIVTPTPTPKVKVVDENWPHRATTVTLPQGFKIATVVAPNIVPLSLPPIDMTASAPDSIMVGGSRGTTTGGHTGGLLDGDPSSGGDQWDAREILMHVLTTIKPRYPDVLRAAGAEGRVLVQFTVDTTGRVDMNSVKILSSTHDLFSRAVRDAIGGFRFRPAEVGGHRVAALAQMPFDFQLTR